jgi:hypothetical protein
MGSAGSRLDGIDLATFWEDSAYARAEYVGAPLTDGMVRAAEAALGYRLPASYVALLRSQNGGIPARTRHRTRTRTTWAHDHVALTGIFGVDPVKSCSLTGAMGQRLWLDEWEYPAIGVYFADCPSAGHDLFCLDYRRCGPEGEPSVVHVDQEWDYAITELAPTFEAFVRGLESDEAFAGD